MMRGSTVVFPNRTRPVECKGDSCSTPFAAPSEVTPSSSTFKGAGNLAPEVAPAASKAKAEAEAEAEKRKQRQSGRSKGSGAGRSPVGVMPRKPAAEQSDEGSYVFEAGCWCLCCWLFGLLVPGVAGAVPSAHPFEIVPGSFHFIPSSGQAGAHGDWTTSLISRIANLVRRRARRITMFVRSCAELPVGFIGNVTAVPTCTPAQLVGVGAIGEGNPECSPASQVGTVSFEIDTRELALKKYGPVV